jgi:hypothetical protein
MLFSLSGYEQGCVVAKETLLLSDMFRMKEDESRNFFIVVGYV